jgi:tRNA(His) 5'-end guanylyltransferase
MNDIGDRMKRNYENRAQTHLTRRTPVIIRLDGRAFHTYTRSFSKPFDSTLIWSMQNATQALVHEVQGCVLGYTQSDEISLLVCDWKTLTSEAWFDYNVQKLCSVSASFATVAFNSSIGVCGGSQWAMFDSRCFNIPGSEVANYFLWRTKDWYRNSVTMYAQSQYSHKELHGKSCGEMHEMLYQKGRNWATDLNDAEKNGTFVTEKGKLCLSRAAGGGGLLLLR